MRALLIMVKADKKNEGTTFFTNIISKPKKKFKSYWKKGKQLNYLSTVFHFLVLDYIWNTFAFIGIGMRCTWSFDTWVEKIRIFFKHMMTNQNNPS